MKYRDLRDFMTGLEKLGELDALVVDYVAESGEPAALPALDFELAALALAATS